MGSCTAALLIKGQYYLEAENIVKSSNEETAFSKLVHLQVLT